MNTNKDHIAKGESALDQQVLDLRLKIVELESELSNARNQGLENEKDVVTLRLELQALVKKFEKHQHKTTGKWSTQPLTL